MECQVGISSYHSQVKITTVWRIRKSMITPITRNRSPQTSPTASPMGSSPMSAKGDSTPKALIETTLYSQKREKMQRGQHL